MVIVDRFKTGTGLVEASITVDGTRHDLFFRSQLELSDNAGDALLLLALPAAMRRGGPLIIEAPVSPQLLKQVPAIQDIYRTWDTELRCVGIDAPVRKVSHQPFSLSPAREAVSFSAGVDSFYSALEEMPDASLVFFHGLDIPLDNHDLRRRVSEKVAWVASELNRPLLEMETNLREGSDPYLKWQLAYGGALAACALLLSRHLDVFGIPAGQSLVIFQPDGANPALNALSSTEDVMIKTVGCKTTRIDKVEAIASHPVVQGALRVCWENRGDAYNCGVCEKCLRTMAALEIFGELPAYSTFDVALDYGRLSRSLSHDPSVDMFTLENLRAARERKASPTLIRSIEKSLDPRRVKILRLLRRKIPRRVYDWIYRAFPHRKKAAIHVEQTPEN